MDTSEPEGNAPTWEETEPTPSEPHPTATGFDAEVDGQDSPRAAAGRNGREGCRFDRLTQVLAYTLNRRGQGGWVAVSLAALGMGSEAEAKRSRRKRARQEARTFGCTGDAAPGKLDDPIDIAVDSDGNIYVADTFDARIQVFAPTVV